MFYLYKMTDSKKIEQAVLDQLGFESLNDIQQKTISVFSKKKDLLLLAPTGSGKTLAFLIPLLQLLDSNLNEVQALIIAPTRELALQIEKVFKSLKSQHKVTCCYGGHEMRVERNSLLSTPSLVIGTPGRLIDHLSKGNIDLSHAKLVVLDEFDKSLELGFEDQIRDIFRFLPKSQRHILTSATPMDRLPEFVPQEKIEELNFIGETEKNLLKQKVVYTTVKEKSDTILSLVSGFKGDPCIIFCNHRESVDRLSFFFKDYEFVPSTLHGGMDQAEREINLIKFRMGASNILIATDLASRGLDIPEIKHVVHYQLPKQEDAYIHRNGRTARMNASGVSYLILTQEEYLPRYIEEKPEEITPEANAFLPVIPEYVCLYISAGKGDKISKGDIVGYLTKKGDIKGDAIGQIHIQDKSSYVAIRKDLVDTVLQNVRNEKLKKTNVKIAVAR
ncbi:superfamily II DNA/RNA helicase [Mongoliibacter ruber]|uniref:Superfamily II DNA/RNA helicase n=2 Tax=Mongoliibacter ruber TaxID=1750599 RepID=A0A2T0WK97_9BACT|nr:superfamily II DNA/RNA helicase [Mongoliibacter ruber]